jgi:hypothetical protein
VLKRDASPSYKKYPLPPLKKVNPPKVSKRGETPLLKSSPLPLNKGKGIKGIGFKTNI